MLWGGSELQTVLSVPACWCVDPSTLVSSGLLCVGSILPAHACTYYWGITCPRNHPWIGPCGHLGMVLLTGAADRHRRAPGTLIHNSHMAATPLL